MCRRLDLRAPRRRQWQMSRLAWRPVSRLCRRCEPQAQTLSEGFQCIVSCSSHRTSGFVEISTRSMRSAWPRGSSMSFGLTVGAQELPSSTSTYCSWKLGSPVVPFHPLFGFWFPYKVTNPKRVPLLSYGYWAIKENGFPAFVVGTLCCFTAFLLCVAGVLPPWNGAEREYIWCTPAGVVGYYSTLFLGRPWGCFVFSLHGV